jgi:hypothetical protein
MDRPTGGLMFLLLKMLLLLLLLLLTGVLECVEMTAKLQEESDGI